MSSASRKSCGAASPFRPVTPARSSADCDVESLCHKTACLSGNRLNVDSPELRANTVCETIQ